MDGGLTTNELLLRRLATGSQPGGRDDDYQVALAVEGGGMRGVVSGGMLLALEQLGMRDCFDFVVGTSAGAIGGAFFAAGHATQGSVLYYDELNRAPFLDKRRLWKLNAAIDLDYLIDVAFRLRGLELADVAECPIPVYATVTPVEPDNPTRVLAATGSPERVRAVLRATASLPVLAGASKPVDGALYVDGGITEQVPWRSAITLGASHVLVLPSRPVRAGEARTPMTFVERLTVLRVVRARHGERVAELTRSLPDRASIEASGLRTVADGTGTGLTHDLRGWHGHISIVELASGSPLIDRLETRRPVLVDGLMLGARALLDRFGLDGVSVEQRVVLNHPVAKVTQFRSQALADVVAQQGSLEPRELRPPA